MSTLEQKAIELDEIRKARILRSNEIDVDKYLQFTGKRLTDVQ